MTAHDPNFAREQRGILRWLGFGAIPQPDPSPAAAADIEAPLDPRERRRRQLLSDVASFILTHRLEVSPFTLAVAHDAITGADQRLASQIETRVAARQPVTLEWLEELGRSGSREDSQDPLSDYYDPAQPAPHR